MERVLITGANGFIGRAVTALAAKEKDWQIYRLVSGIKTSAPPPADTKYSNCIG